LSNDIEFLIRELEEEETTLRRFIQDAVKEGEYLIAHYHTERRAQIWRQLQTLRNFDDSLYDHKKMLERLIQGSEAMLKSRQGAVLKEYLEGKISNDKAELEELNRRGKVPSPQSNILEKHLGLLLDKEIKGVKLVLYKSKRFMMVFKRHRGGLSVSIPNMRSLRGTYLMDEDNFIKFLTLGFSLAEDKRRLVLLLEEDRPKLLMQLKTIICIIVFEIFYFEEFQGEGVIEVEG
jgi:hypothetical protein